MRKIFIVVADNGLENEEHERWNVAAFGSHESAWEFVEKFTREIHAAIARTEELEELFDKRGTTLEEEKEYARVNDLACEYWHFFDHGKFIITVIDFRE